MPKFIVDFTDAEDFAPIPADIYEVEIKEVQLKTSQKGEGMIAIVLEVIDGEHQGRHLYTNLMLAGRGLGITKAAFQALQIPAGELDTDDLVGASASVRVTLRKWAVEDGGDGRVRNRISGWIDPSELD